MAMCPTCQGPANPVLCARGGVPGATYVYCGICGLVLVPPAECQHPRTYFTTSGSERCSDCYVPVNI